MKTINQIISEYKATTDALSELKKAADELKKSIIEYASGVDCFTTEEYTVIIKESKSVRLDTAALYKDFPDIKQTYGKTTTSKSIDIATNAEKKTA